MQRRFYIEGELNLMAYAQHRYVGRGKNRQKATILTPLSVIHSARLCYSLAALCRLPGLLTSFTHSHSFCLATRYFRDSENPSNNRTDLQAKTRQEKTTKSWGRVDATENFTPNANATGSFGEECSNKKERCHKKPRSRSLSRSTSNASRVHETSYYGSTFLCSFCLFAFLQFCFF